MSGGKISGKKISFSMSCVEFHATGDGNSSPGGKDLVKYVVGAGWMGMAHPGTCRMQLNVVSGFFWDSLRALGAAKDQVLLLSLCSQG